MEITECAGFQKLLSAVKNDEKVHANQHDYRAKLQWIVDRAKLYAEKTGLEPSVILDTWEDKRSYWYMNYYQESNVPDPSSNRFRIFKTVEEFKESAKEPKFRCPLCGGISTNPYECNSGKKMNKNEVCDWKVYGLLSDLGKGVFVYFLDLVEGNKIFMPIAWEKDYEGEPK